MVHLRGVGPGRLLRNVLAGAEGDRRCVLLHRARILDRRRARRRICRSAPAVAPAGWLLALIPVMFSYSGWNAATYVAEEIRDPGRNLPRALALGTGAVVVHLSAAQRAVSLRAPGRRAGRAQRQRAGRDRGAAARAARRQHHGRRVDVSLAASISAMTFAGPRVYFAMARDGAVLPRAARDPPALPHAGGRPSSRRQSGARCWS